MIRQATLDDLPAVFPLLKHVFDQSIFNHMTYKPHEAQRAFVSAVSFDEFYCKVCVKNNVIVGLLGGVVSPNVWGVHCGQDIFMYSKGGTHLLIKDFYKWCATQQAEFVQITDFSGSKRYQKLIEAVGFKKHGSIFIGEV